MILHLAVYPLAKDEKDCVPETMTYQAFSTSWENAERDLENLRKITEKDAKAEADKYE